MKKNYNVTGAVIIKEDKVLIAKRTSTGYLGSMWEFPGGKIEQGETPWQALQRELKEELGVDAFVGAFIGESTTDYGDRIVNLKVYFADIEGDPIPLVHDELKWVRLCDLSAVDLAEADKFVVDLIA